MLVCLNCGGATMRPEGDGYACQDPDCLRYLYVVYPEPATVPLIWRGVDLARGRDRTVCFDPRNPSGK